GRFGLLISERGRSVRGGRRLLRGTVSRRVRRGFRRGLRWRGGTLLRQPRQRVENVQASPAAHIALRDAQVRGGDDQRQGAFGAEREHSLARTAVPPSPETDPTLANPEDAYIKPRFVGVCHLGNFALHQA